MGVNGTEWTRVSIQVWRPQCFGVPGLVADMGARFDAPAFRSLHIDVFIAAVTLSRTGPLHSKLHEIDSSFRSFGRCRDFVIEHDMTPVGPHQLGLATLRSPSHQLG